MRVKVNIAAIPSNSLTKAHLKLLIAKFKNLPKGKYETHSEVASGATYVK